MLNHYKVIGETRKNHECVKCDTMIPKGSKAVSGVTKTPIVNHGKFTYGYFHENCAASLSLVGDVNHFGGNLSLIGDINLAGSLSIVK